MLVKGKLNLNRHPSEVTNGDWTDAVNVIVSEDNVVQNEPAFVNDEDFVNAINNSNIFTDEEDYDIINVIDCNEELVIFCRVDNNDVRLLRYKENTKTIENTGVIIDYHNGKFTNDFQYINNKLVITFSEYDGDEDIVLKVIDFDSNVNNEIAKYQNPEVIIPKVYNFYKTGYTYKGWYFVFIRYKIKNNNYTKWYNTNHSSLVDECVDTVLIDDKNGILKKYIKSKFSTTLDICNITNEYMFDNLDKRYSSYQIGFIIKTKDYTKYFKTEDININNNIFLVNNKNIIEFDNTILDNYNDYYNINSLNFYKNKTYIANYKEKNIKLDDLKDITINLTINKQISISRDSQITNTIWNTDNGSYILNRDTYGWYYCIEGAENTIMSWCKVINSNNKLLNVTGAFFTNLPYYYYNSNNKKVKISDYNRIINYYPEKHKYCIFENNNTPIYVDKLFIDSINSGGFIVQTIIDGKLTAAPGSPFLVAYHTFKGNIIYRNDGEDNNITEGDNNQILNYVGFFPNQYYNFFIHFVDKFGNYTDGINITKLNLNTDNITLDETKILLEGFDTIGQGVYPPLTFNTIINKYPTGYIGYFISYEKFENEITFSGELLDNNNISNIELDYKDRLNLNNTNIITYDVGSIVGAIFSNKQTYNFSIVNTNILVADSYNNINNSTRLHFELLHQNIITGEYIQLRTDKKNLYNNTIKKLIPCSPISYKFDNECNGKNGFISKDISFVFTGVFYNDTKFKYENIKIGDNPTGGDTIIYLKEFNVYKEIPTEFIYFNNEPQVIIAPTGEITEDENKKEFKGTVIIKPMNTSDLFKERHYNIGDAYPVVYQNYIEDNYINEFTKTIRRSKIIQDESNTIDNRFFPLESYINIIENKGNIIKLTPVGNIILVHTEYSLFLFDGSDTLKADKYKVQLNEADIWDVGYKEVMTTEKGTAGIEKPEHAIVGEFGYIFYDKKQQYIFRFDNNNIVHIEDDIKQYLVKLKNYDLNITNDVKRNRLLFNFTKDNNNSVVLSYNYKFNKWVSKHTYHYIKGYNTINNIYLLNKDRKTFSKFSNEKYNTNASIDILFNSQYEVIKFIEYIKYKLYKTTPKDINDSYPVEGHIDYYAGNTVRVFTEFCDTNDIDLSEYGLDDKTNSVERYDEPYFRFGNWHINNLRNNKVEEGEERNRIYGNWFVVRIKFGDNKKVELESIDCKFSPDIV